MNEFRDELADEPEEVQDERTGTPPAGLASFRIATYNVHSCVGIDAKFSPERVAEVVRGLECDVVGLQEVGWHHRGEIGRDQFAAISQGSGLKAYPGPTKHNERAHYGNALLTNLPVLAVRPIDLSLPMREPRGAIDADIQVGDRVVRVIVAHLGLDPWERNAQITRVLHAMEAGPPRPTVFMGDLNEWRGRSPRLKRLARSFDDCAAPRSFHVRLPALRLDRIYVTGELQLASFEVVKTKHTRRASDHLPVRATIAVRR
ncbi:endonuclease/exonuclease/phosphatase family protein [Arenibaculum pallidiluteum]|uniref:endonuclease/exonuclease/phosphatase family protein n=1 Tax=Arenibaculum pallidiluteum TaxID=2812559 RepID=UPI001A9709C8|nr:endonuclease/exonuclease/phosphatase family protein [Arenibaculum pallidiluteum]